MPASVSANNIGGASYAPSSIGSASRFQSTWRTSNDSQTFYINAKWDAAHRAGVQAYTADGYRYTQDFRDLHANLHATGRFASTLLSPVYDRDDDNGDRRWEEAEITSNSVNFPSVGENYYSDVQLSHWYANCNGGCYTWDSGSGSVGYQSQISRWDALFGEWNTHKFSGTYRKVPYPVQYAPSAATSSTDSASAGDSGQDRGSTKFTADVDGLVVIGEADGRELDVRVASPARPDEYIASNKRRAATVLGLRGPYRVIVTFDRPLSGSAFLAIANGPGVEVTYVEAIGLNSKKQILTVGGDPGILGQIDAEFEMRNGSLSGIVAAEAIVEDKRAYDVLSSNSSVVLADVAPELVRRRLGAVRPDVARDFNRFDLIVDDLYWMTGELPR